MHDKQTAAPDSTAVRVALWRAIHVQVDPPPHVLEDEIGLRLVAPEDDWRRRPDMDPHVHQPFRASIVARARFIEDLVAEAGRPWRRASTSSSAPAWTRFAQRRPEIASRLRMFEVDRPGPQAWKRQRLIELGFGVPEWLRLVPVDFEAGDAWWQRLVGRRLRCRPAGGRGLHRCQYVPHQGRDRGHAAPGRGARPGIHARDDFLLPLELADPEVRPGLQLAEKGRAQAGHLSSASSRRRRCWHLPAKPALEKSSTCRQPLLRQRYFAGRTDGLRPPNNAEELLVAAT